MKIGKPSNSGVGGLHTAGAFLNEGTALHDMFVKEVISRCTYIGGWTNPENPSNPFKRRLHRLSWSRLESGHFKEWVS
ncbi:hypothetical protein BTO28_14180 [Domibacillus epiphyticus]|uniref:Uncharacterized protein n=1 Tax=Domibacillus epiphyticus TaxID=1714355 RepID=A0A1V2A5D6_9BACI|nr:hypothetical protein BTO28_14180 [Domibacillus epiphyticus]